MIINNMKLIKLLYSKNYIKEFLLSLQVFSLVVLFVVGITPFENNNFLNIGLKNSLDLDF